MSRRAQKPCDAQAEVIAFLADPRSYTPKPETVTRIDTHGAMVFLAGDAAYKIKRAVKYPYMDFSTLEKRQAVCEQEIAVNRDNAPDIYLGTVPITRAADGRLAFGGDGEAVEWAVSMRRFDETRSLDRIAERAGLDDALLARLAERIAAAHARAPIRRDFDQGAAFAKLVSQDEQEFAAAPELFDPEKARRLIGGTRAELKRNAKLLAARGTAGHVRRCHGDLHLKNLVLIDDEPVLFDAIEFDEDIATVDVLYDLAFLLMDLETRVMRHGANLVLNTYLKAARQDAHLDGLAALPLFLSSRAAIRARVTASLSAHEHGRARTADAQVARSYFEAALGFLKPEPARLIAVGGLSGSGKTTIARMLAPHIGAAPGAIHLRSDVERKVLFGVAETERLGPRGYSPEASQKTYERLFTLAGRVLGAGRSVIVDAVFARPKERGAIKAVAREREAPFTGLWLDTPEEVMIARVEDRRRDASDARAEIVRQQLTYDLGEIDWARVAAAGTPGEVLAAALRQVQSGSQRSAR
ncbi:MAG: AAA family ATPase [Hyphomicrobiales bacterium]|nr:AAA family ATPase [Hyphomicrobiales bacterium]